MFELSYVILTICIKHFNIAYNEKIHNIEHLFIVITLIPTLYVKRVKRTAL